MGAPSPAFSHPFSNLAVSHPSPLGSVTHAQGIPAQDEQKLTSEKDPMLSPDPSGEL
jgi:hypothetical protein